MFTNGAKHSTSPREAKPDNLEKQYRPLGLKAVAAAASQRKPETRKVIKGELPAGLKHIESGY